MGNSLGLDDLKVYQKAMEMAERIWQIVSEWGSFEKQTIGKQLVRAADSVAANLSEGYGRYHYKDSQNFIYYARGSLFETKTWLVKAARRGLISIEDEKDLDAKIVELSKMINGYNRSIGKVHEPDTNYSNES